MSRRKCRFEFVDLHLADGAKYEYDQLYASEKRLHFVQEIEDLAEGTTWKALQACVTFNEKTCFGLVKLYVDGTVRELRSEFVQEMNELNGWLDKQITSGDVIEVRLKPLQKINRNANFWQMKVVHVDVGRDFSYRFDSEYANLKTCQFTHYIYHERSRNATKQDLISMDADFLSDTARFPLVGLVTRRDCSDVVVIRRRGRFNSRTTETIWKHGQDLKLRHNFKIEPRDVIEIRLSDVLRYDHMDIPTDDDECEEAQNDKEECIICLHNRRDVVFKPCNHCCVCQTCCKRMPTQMCPSCYAPYKSWHKLKFWSEKEDGKVFYSTAAMDDVYSLLTSLERHCVEDAQVDDLLRK
jgi:hypothetical protein